MSLSLRVALVLAAGLALGLVMSWGVESCKGKQGQQAVDQSNVYHGVADAHQAEAAKRDEQIRALQAARDTAEQAVAGARAEVERLRRKLAQKPSQPSDPVSPGPAVPEPVLPDGRDALIAAQDGLIAQQDIQIQGLKAENALLTASRDEWKATAESRGREAACLRIALDAQKAVSAASKWTGRLQGFAVGIATGYVSGRAR